MAKGHYQKTLEELTFSFFSEDRPQPGPAPLEHALWFCLSLLSREHRGDPVPKAAFHLLKLVSLAGCQEPGGEERS